MSFLNAVADRLLDQYGNDLGDVHLVSPNRRALLFLQKILAQKIQKPVWSPLLFTMDDLVRKHSGLLVADPLLLNYQLYKTWKNAGSDYLSDRFDLFYFWGQVLLRDYDELDREKIHAQRLFSLLEDSMEMDLRIEEWGEDSKAQLSRFMQAIGSGQSTLQESFRNIWKHLGPVYFAFREALKEQGMGYKGMMYRAVAEQKEVLMPYKDRPLVFVGFNRLNRCEQEILAYGRDHLGAQFYWNFDDYLLGERREDAGLFLSRAQANFPDDLGYKTYMTGGMGDVQNLGKKKIKLIEVPYLSAQSQIVIDQLVKAREGKDSYAYDHTLVMLPNEKILDHLLLNLPDEVQPLNVSLGLPITTTSLFRLMSAYIGLHTRARAEGKVYYKDIEKLAFHPLLSLWETDFYRHFTGSAQDEGAKGAWKKAKSKIYFSYEDLPSSAGSIWAMVFSRPDGSTFFDRLLGILEFLYKEELSDGVRWLNEHAREIVAFSHSQLVLLRDIFKEQNIHLDFEYLPGLVSDIFRMNRLPFRGEPLIGLQILGTMEARNLAFDRVLIPSAEEGFLPSPMRNSFIPFSIRQLFAFPDKKEDAAEQAYYFYAVLQHAREVTLLYSQSREGMGGKEKSRFLRQIEIWAQRSLQNWEIESLTLPVESVAKPTRTEVLQRENTFAQAYKDLLTKQHISPSALVDHLECPLRFFYKHICQLKEDRDLSEDLDSATFGQAFHKAMEFLYEPYVGKVVRVEDLEALYTQVVPALEKALQAVSGLEAQAYASGINLVNKSTLEIYLQQTLNKDRHRAPFTLVKHEYRLDPDHVQLSLGGLKVRLKGFIDRLDKVGDTLEIIDYKTGTDSEYFRGLEEFTGDAKKLPKAVFQLLLYGLVADQLQDLQSSNYQLQIYKLREIVSKGLSGEENHGEGYLKKGTPKNAVPYLFTEEERKAFRGILEDLVNRMLDQDIPIVKVKDPQACLFCPYKVICDRSHIKNHWS
jgi:CRISPR/Cas system-associated exonuclease Cas4 (RecB family)